MPWNAIWFLFSKAHNYKQLSVGCVLLTTDYDDPKSCVLENYTLFTTGSWRVYSMHSDTNGIGICSGLWHLREFKVRMTFVTRGFRFQMQTPIKFDFLLNFLRNICLSCLIIPTVFERTLRQRIVDFNNFQRKVRKKLVTFCCIAFYVLKVKFLAVLAH